MRRVLAFVLCVFVLEAKATLRDGLDGTVTTRCGQCSFQDTLYMQQACNGRVNPFMQHAQRLLLSRCDVTEACNRTGRTNVSNNKPFDFIIVGAGVAGPVIARRLSDNAEWRVLLIEAGPEEPTMTSVPGFSTNGIATQVDWKYKTERQAGACLDQNGYCSWPRGKMVSGSAGLYGMMYVRGHPAVLNKWAADGNVGWSYNEALPYFKRAESPDYEDVIRNRSDNPASEDAHLKLGQFNDRPDFQDAVFEAARELGSYVGALDGYKHTGFTVPAFLTYQGKRGTTSKYYLRPVSDRKNLKVLINGHVTRVLVDKNLRMATGVEVLTKQGKMVYRASKEVILSAGTVASPQILMLSGIGPKDHLRRLGIDVIEDLAVGRNLHNHVSMGFSMSINDTSRDFGEAELREFLDGKGPLGSTGLTQVTGFLESKYARDGVPDLQVFLDGYSNSCPTGKNVTTNRQVLNARPTVVNTKSVGYLELKSKDPLEHPLINPRYFSDPRDMKVLLEGVKLLMQIKDAPVMKQWDLRIDEEKHPKCSEFDFYTDDYWECYIRQTTGPENHQGGTCKMGPSFDRKAVVDMELRVYGISNLRVVDASIFPSPVCGNPTGTIVMTAEKASALIEGAWKQRD